MDTVITSSKCVLIFNIFQNFLLYFSRKSSANLSSDIPQLSVWGNGNSKLTISLKTFRLAWEQIPKFVKSTKKLNLFSGRDEQKQHTTRVKQV